MSRPTLCEQAAPSAAAPVGRVLGVMRYPVKSMAEESLTSAEVHWHGISGDRRWGLVRPRRQQSGFPWLTIREVPDLWKYRARLVDPSRPDGSSVVVRTPTGNELSVLDPGLVAELGGGLRVMKLDRGTFDMAPVSLLTTRSVASIEPLVGGWVNPLRFRPNVLIEAFEDVSFPEHLWVGGTIRIGGAWIRIDQRDRRCAVVNVDPDTADRDPRVLRVIAQHLQATLGVYGAVQQSGRIAVGDEVLFSPSVR